MAQHFRKTRMLRHSVGLSTSQLEHASSWIFTQWHLLILCICHWTHCWQSMTHS